MKEWDIDNSRVQESAKKKKNFVIFSEILLRIHRVHLTFQFSR